MSDTWTKPSPVGRRIPARIGVLRAVAALAALVFLIPAGPTMVAAGPSVHGVGVTLVRGPLLAETPSTFWSLDAQTSCASCLWSDPHVRSYLNTTPFQWVRYGTDVDRCNASANLLYGDDGIASTSCAYDLRALKNWCLSQVPTCHAIIALPGENNNSQEDAALAQWIVGTLGFHPDFWEVGNEPTGWTHFGIPWTHWSTKDASKPTPVAYAFDVKSTIAAVHKVVPAARFIGVEAACSCNNLWFTDIGKIVGGSIAAIGYHSYPSSGTTQETLDSFYAPLSSKSNLSSSYAAVRSALLLGCPSCARTPIFVNEYNAGPGWAPSNFAGRFPDAVFLAASVTQALTTNVSQFTVYNLQTPPALGYGFSLIDRQGTPGPAGVLYEKILKHLVVGQVYQSHLSTTVGGVYSVVTRNGSSVSILVVNTNRSQSLGLQLWKGIPTSLPTVTYVWGPAQSQPSVRAGALALAYSVGTQSILLLQLTLPATASPLGLGAPSFAAAP